MNLVCAASWLSGLAFGVVFGVIFTCHCKKQPRDSRGRYVKETDDS